MKRQQRRPFRLGLAILVLLATGLQLLAEGHPLARELLEEIVAIDTTPAKGCTKAAEAMAARLRSGGFAAPDLLLLGDRPDKRNLVVRMRGEGKAKPILLIAHLDTVDAPREGWSEGLDPFRVMERDGFLYGRGVGDDKGAVAGRARPADDGSLGERRRPAPQGRYRDVRCVRDLWRAGLQQCPRRERASARGCIQ